MMLAWVGAQDGELRNDYCNIITIRNLVPWGHETRLALLGVASLAISTSAGKYFGYQQEQSSHGDDCQDLVDPIDWTPRHPLE
jgi:hypothetical protein